MQFEPSETLNEPEQILNALIAYEGTGSLRNPIPAGTKLLSVRIDDRTCIVDLTGEFLDGCTTIAEEQSAVHSIIATLCALDGIDSTEILVEGIEPAYRSLNLSHVRQPSADWFAK